MNRRIRSKIAGSLLALATVFSLVSISAYSDTQGSDRREGHRDDRGGARDTRQAQGLRVSLDWSGVLAVSLGL